MRIVLYLIAYIILLTSSSCNVHQWPEASKYAKLHLRLNYETEITEWKYLYNDDDIKELGLGKHMTTASNTALYNILSGRTLYLGNNVQKKTSLRNLYSQRILITATITILHLTFHLENTILWYGQTW